MNHEQIVSRLNREADHADKFGGGRIGALTSWQVRKAAQIIRDLRDVLDEISEMAREPDEPLGDGPAPERDRYWPEDMRGFANRLGKVGDVARDALSFDRNRGADEAD